MARLRRFAWADRVHKSALGSPVAKHTIPAKDAYAYRATMRGLQGFAEHAAPEAFKWVAWSVAIAAIEVVRRRTDADWLLVLEVALAFLVLARMVWRLSPAPAPETEELDGGVSFELTPRGWGWSVLVSLACWLLMLILTVGLARLIADSELLAERPASVAPASQSPQPPRTPEQTPAAPRPQTPATDSPRDAKGPAAAAPASTPQR